jgi:hypothetical protein
MADFEFPDKCTYCSTYYKVENCLLPYEVVKKFISSDDKHHRIMEITQLHNNYGSHMLYVNCNFVLQRIDVPFIPASTHSDNLSYQHNSFDNETDYYESQSEHSSSISATLSAKAEEFIPHTKADEEQPPVEEIINEVKTTSNENVIVFKRHSRIDDEWEGPTDADKEIERVEAINNDFEHITHIITDAADAITTAFLFNKDKKVGKRTLELIKNLRTEINHCCTSNKSYTRFKDQTLNHTIPVARQLVASHDNNQLLNWLDNNKPNSNNHCILQYKSFAENSHTATIDRIIPMMISYAKAVYDDKDLSHDTRVLITDGINTILTDRKISQSFKWFRSYKPPVVQTTPGIERIKLNSNTAQRLAELTNVQTVHTCPTATEKTEDYISSILPDMINEIMSANSSLSFGFHGRTQGSGEIFNNILKEILRHNPNWNEPGFRTRTHHTEDALRWLNLKATSQEKLSVIWVVSNFFSLLRKGHDSTSQ